MVSCHKIPASLVLNLNQTTLNSAPTGEFTMEKEGSKNVERTGLEQITGNFAVNLDGQISFPSTCYTKERPTVSTLCTPSLVSLMSFTPRSTGKME